MSSVVELFTGKKERKREIAAPAPVEKGETEAERRRRANRDARRRASQLRRGGASTVLTGGRGVDESTISQRTVLGG